MVIRVSFHWTMKATIKAVVNVDRPWIVSVSFSEIPLFTSFPFVVTWVVTEAASAESKYAISCRRICLTKSMRSALVVLMAAMDILTCGM